MLYQDTGLYQSHQFGKANALTLQMTYDELFLLWNQELRYRPNFGTVNPTAQMPVIFAQVDGVEKGKPEPYWKKTRQLIDDGTKLYTTFPFCPASNTNPCQGLALKAIRNGQLQREMLQASPQYPFSLLREALQQHLLDKLQWMLDRKLIKGTFVNGTEYTVVATVMNMGKSFVRTLQKFDFTKKNPKIVVVCTGEKVCSL